MDTREPHGHPGATLLIQRHRSALNLNPHGHLIAADGLFVRRGEGQSLAFEPLPPPSTDELGALLDRVIKRTVALYQSHQGTQDDVDPDELLLAQAMSEALRAPSTSPSIAQGSPDDAQSPQTLCLQRDGFSLHANRRVPAHDRAGLEQLLRYGARSPLAASRLEVDEQTNLLTQFRGKLSERCGRT